MLKPFRTWRQMTNYVGHPQALALQRQNLNFDHQSKRQSRWPIHHPATAQLSCSFYKLGQKFCLTKPSHLLSRNGYSSAVGPEWSFWKALSTSFCAKVAQIFCHFLVGLANIPFCNKNAPGYILGHFRKDWASFHSKIWSHCSSVCLSVHLHLDKWFS